MRSTGRTLPCFRCAGRAAAQAARRSRRVCSAARMGAAHRFAPCETAGPAWQDASRPPFDGTHVPNSREDGWSLLLGTGRAAVCEHQRAAFEVVACGSRLVRREGFV